MTKTWARAGTEPACEDGLEGVVARGVEEPPGAVEAVGCPAEALGDGCPLDALGDGWALDGGRIDGDAPPELLGLRPAAVLAGPPGGRRSSTPDTTTTTTTSAETTSRSLALINRSRTAISPPV
ncbi:MAG: hypothetical protein ACREPA_11610 [Candidatus Dormibacteraceae bacterium]